MKHCAQVFPRSANGRNHTDDQSGKQGDREGIRKQTPIETEVEAHGNIELKVDGAKRATAPPAEGHSGDAAGEGENNAFSEQLPNESHTSSAQRRADRHFTSTNRGSNQQDVSNVDTSQQKHHRGQSEEQGRDDEDSVRGIRVGPRTNFRIDNEA